MNFEVGKKYHNSETLTTEYYRICVGKHITNEIGYCTWEVRRKDNDSLFGVFVCKDNYLRHFVPYVKTREVIHERWVYWIKNRSHGEIRAWTSTTEMYKESYERNNPNWTFLKCEKITYTETIEE